MSSFPADRKPRNFWGGLRAGTAGPVIIVGICGFIFSGCDSLPSPVPPEPEGRLAVLGPSPSFSLTALPTDWAIEGRAEFASRLVSVTQKDGVPALRVINGDEPFVVVRRIDAALIVTPYLSWAWSMSPYEGSVHPVRMVVGFSGGISGVATRVPQALPWMGSELPPHDRILSLAFGDSALQRGTLRMSDTGNQAVPRYIVRGGREQTGSWLLETLDLAGIYAQAWPNDESADVRIAFIGLAAEGGRPPSEAAISGIQLSR